MNGKIGILIFLLLLFILTVSKFFFLNGSLHPFEPDEYIYANVAKSLLSSKIPLYQGQPFWDHLPGLAVLASLLERLPFFPTDLFSYFVSVRVISILAGFLTSLIIFYYFNKWEKGNLGIIAALVFQLLPLNLTYSRLGLTYTLATFLAFFFILSWLDAYFAKSVKKLILSGFLLAATFFSNYLALSLLSFPLFALLILGILNKYYKRSLDLSQTSTVLWAIVPLIIGVGSIIVSLLVLYGESIFGYLTIGLRTIFGVQTAEKADQTISLIYYLKSFLLFFNPFLGLNVILSLIFTAKTSLFNKGHV